MPENQDAWDVFLAVRTQWRAGGLGRIGLDYAEVRHAFDRLGIDDGPRNWKKIQAMEAAVLDHDRITDNTAADSHRQRPQSR